MYKKDVYIKIADLLTNLEYKYQIPLLREDIEEWISQNDKNKDIYDIYLSISNLRDL